MQISSTPPSFGTRRAFTKSVAGSKNEISDWRNTMNIKKFFATKAMVLGFGAALLFAGSARAQGTVNAVTYDQQAIQQTANTQNADAATEEALVPLNGWAIGMLLVCMGICVYVVPKTVPNDRNGEFNAVELQDRRWVSSRANSISTVESL
jgi:hypothetical protein